MFLFVLIQFFVNNHCILFSLYASFYKVLSFFTFVKYSASFFSIFYFYNVHFHVYGMSYVTLFTIFQVLSILLQKKRFKIKLIVFGRLQNMIQKFQENFTFNKKSRLSSFSSTVLCIFDSVVLQQRSFESHNISGC